jgi:hypothetical protein
MRHFKSILAKTFFSSFVSYLTAPNIAAKVRRVVIAIVTRPGIDSKVELKKQKQFSNYLC